MDNQQIDYLSCILHTYKVEQKIKKSNTKDLIKIIETYSSYINLPKEIDNLLFKYTYDKYITKYEKKVLRNTCILLETKYVLGQNKIVFMGMKKA